MTIPIALRGFEESQKCRICHDYYRNCVVLKKCGHSFCSECIRKAIQSGLTSGTRRKATCPQCREDLGGCNVESMIVPNRSMQESVSEWKSYLTRQQTLNSGSNNEEEQNELERITKGNNDVAGRLCRNPYARRLATGNDQQQRGLVNTESSVSHPLRKLPLVNYAGLKRKQLLDLCQKAGLSTKGKDIQLKERHQSFVTFWNSEMDGITTIKSAKEILRDFNDRERSKDTEKKKELTTGSTTAIDSQCMDKLRDSRKSIGEGDETAVLSSGNAEFDRKLKNGFSNLIQQMKAKQKTNGHGKKNDLPQERQQQQQACQRNVEEEEEEKSKCGEPALEKTPRSSPRSTTETYGGKLYGNEDGATENKPTTEIDRGRQQASTTRDNNASSTLIQPETTVDDSHHIDVLGNDDKDDKEASFNLWKNYLADNPKPQAAPQTLEDLIDTIPGINLSNRKDDSFDVIAKELLFAGWSKDDDHDGSWIYYLSESKCISLDESQLHAYLKRRCGWAMNDMNIRKTLAEGNLEFNTNDGRSGSSRDQQPIQVSLSSKVIGETIPTAEDEKGEKLESSSKDSTSPSDSSDEKKSSSIDLSRETMRSISQANLPTPSGSKRPRRELDKQSSHPTLKQPKKTRKSSRTPLTWECGLCTFKNKPRRMTCEMCGQARGGIAASVSSSG